MSKLLGAGLIFTLPSFSSFRSISLRNISALGLRRIYDYFFFFNYKSHIMGLHIHFYESISTSHCATQLQENLANKKLSSFFWDLHKDDCQCSNSNFQMGLTSCPLLSQSAKHTDLIPGHQRYLAVILVGKNVFPSLTRPKMEMFLYGSEEKKMVINQCLFQAVR